MAQQDAVIRLLLVEDQLEDAEQLISMLRNGGMAVRPQRPENADELRNDCSRTPADRPGAGRTPRCRVTLPFADVAKRVEATGKDIPVLAGGRDALDEKTILAAASPPARATSALRRNAPSTCSSWCARIRRR